MLFFATIVRRNTTRNDSCFPETLYLRQNLICPPASRLYLKGLLNILQTVSSCSRYTIFFLFGSRFHRQNLPIPKHFRSDLRTNLSLNADVSENTLPFVSQSINNFNDYDISQSHDWECPSLSRHVFLTPLLRLDNRFHFFFGKMRLILELVFNCLMFLKTR